MSAYGACERAWLTQPESVMGYRCDEWRNDEDMSDTAQCVLEPWHDGLHQGEDAWGEWVAWA